MPGLLIKIFFVLCLLPLASAAQDALPVNTKTEAISDIKTLLPSATNKKPLLINFWATWCGPCRVEFPELVRIDAEYRARGLNFAIVSLDNFGAMDFIVADFLKVYRSTMPSYLLDLNRTEAYRAIRRLAPRSSYGIPLTLLFDQNGKLVYHKNGVIDAKLLRAKIDKLLPGKPVAEKKL